MDLMTYLLAIKNGSGQGVTYTLSADTLNKKIVLTPSTGDAQSITVPYATDASTINGHDVPELENGKIPAAYLPSYVDDVVEYTSRSDFPSEGESGKIYIDLTTNKIYRWSGSIYAEISESLALGETSTTAYRGDRGKIAYNHSQATGNPHGATLADLNDDATHRVVTDTEKATWSGKQDALTFDDVPTDGSNNPVKSNGIYGALATKANSADLATVATTGDYDDLTNKPTIPVIEANPSGEAAAEMQKLQIDSTIYKFASQKAYGEITDVDIASFSDGADNEPLKSLKVAITPQQASGIPSPENPLPISGWTGAKIHNFGLPNGYKAVDYVKLSAPIIYDGITDFNRNDLCIITEFKVETVSSYGAIYSAYSAETNNATRLIQNGTSPNSLLVNNNAGANSPSTVAQSGGYIPNGFNKFISFHSSFNINGNTSSSSVVSGNDNTATSLNICSSSNSVSFRRFDIQSWRTEDGETIYTPLCSLIPCTNPQGVGGFWDAIGEKFYTTSDPTKITATGTPNRGTEHITDVIYPITFKDSQGNPLTIYGGKIHIRCVNGVWSGEIESTRIGIDMGSIEWNGNLEQNHFYTRLDIPYDRNKGNTIISSVYKNDGAISRSPYYSPNNFSFTYWVGSSPISELYITDKTGYSSFDSYKTAMSGQILSYEVETPITYTINPSDIPNILTMLGYNNLWSDTGEILDLVYVRDLNTYLKSLDDRITALENA